MLLLLGGERSEGQRQRVLYVPSKCRKIGMLLVLIEADAGLLRSTDIFARHILHDLSSLLPSPAIVQLVPKLGHCLIVIVVVASCGCNGSELNLCIR